MITGTIEGFWVQGDPRYEISVQNPFIIYTNLYVKLTTDFDKKTGEKYLWALFMLLDASCQILFEHAFEDRKTLIAAHYLQKPKFNWKILEPYFDLYQKEFLTRIKRNALATSNSLDKINNKMNDIDETSIAEMKLLGTLSKNLSALKVSYKLDMAEFAVEKKEVEASLHTRGNVALGPDEALMFNDK